MSNQPGDWSPQSWRGRRARHQPEYVDQTHYESVLRRLSELPPLVFPGEVAQLRERIALAAEGRAFMLHGGDCVERFADCNAQTIANKLKILLQMSVVLSHAARVPVVRVGRIAGQFFKPRSEEYETIAGRRVLTYRGDTVNGFQIDDRDVDPDRLLQGYFHATATLNYIRSMIDGGFADLHHPYSWNLHAMERTPNWDDYRRIVDSILDAIHFMESFGGLRSESIGRIDFSTSHEGLHLGFEEAMTRRDGDRWYNLGAHLLWIGERTRSIDDAHVEYFRGIANPVGIKVSAQADPREIVEVVRRLNPENEPGRVVIITRMGANLVSDALPPLIDAVASAGLAVAWVCDPMHGNTVTLASGRKTRAFDDVLRELQTCFEVHSARRHARPRATTLAGVHFELTGDEVTECTGGAQGLRETDLESNYQTFCDPRLNYEQSMEMAFLISRFLKAR
ncbi:MAG: 3-deoxy-7-phosphoheptulonate synthase [Spirochaetaceae bacterium]|nr:MAG: 3-deoxy-7-phosphoheptulonate synthase [Spirochaetaceae bacterium]